MHSTYEKLEEIKDEERGDIHKLTNNDKNNYYAKRLCTLFVIVVVVILMVFGGLEDEEPVLVGDGDANSQLGIRTKPGAGDCFLVTDTTHTGKYFNFYNDDAEDVFGDNWPTAKTQGVHQWRLSGSDWFKVRSGTVIAWNSDNRTPQTQGTGHGRWVTSPDQEQ
eukprot:UN23300